MTAAGDQVLALAYTQVGNTENPPNSNLCSPYTDAWGAGAWCAMFVSWVDAAAGYPLPPINGPAGFSYCPDGQVAAFNFGRSVGSGGVEPGDALIFSWEPWHMEGGIAICSYGGYAGAPAGDHTGFFAGWLGGGYMRTVEGNTSQSSWDNGGAVMERTDRYDAQICCYARHAALGSGGGGGPITPPQEEEDDTMYQPLLVVTEGSPWKGSVFLCAGGYALGLGDESILKNMQARGYCKPVIEVNDWDIYGAYMVVYPSGPGAVPRG
jgi:hypothetical protein